MHPAQLLYRLQETDLSIAALDRQLDEIAEGLGTSEDVLAAQSAVKGTAAELQKWQTLLRDRELETKGVVGKLKASEEQLYSGRVRNPKELKGLQEEVQSLRRRRSTMEDQVLEAMLRADELEEQLSVQHTDLDEITRQWEAGQARLLEEQADLKRRREKLRAELEVRAAGVGEDLPLYQDLRQRKGGRPVALLKDAVCQACGMTLPTGEVQKVKYGGELCLCSSCGRILWAP